MNSSDIRDASRPAPAHLPAAGDLVPIRPDFGASPVVIRLPVDRRLAVFVLALVCLWGAVGTIAGFRLLAPMTERTRDFEMLLPFLLALLVSGAIMTVGWRALRLYVGEQQMEIHGDFIRCRRPGLLADLRWREPLAAYSGVRLVTIATEAEDRPWRLVELVHDRRDRTVPLYLERSRQPLTRLATDLAERLGKPIIRGN